MNYKLNEIIEKSIVEVIGTDSQVESKFKELIDKHQEKVHFIPLKYRTFGGFLQSLNIRFGNFLEVFIGNVIDLKEDIEVLHVSERMGLKICDECERKINRHIDYKGDINELNERLNELYEIIFKYNTKKEGNYNKRNRDVDILIKEGDVYTYIEVKYNDDHDTGKFDSINRKALKTYAGLVNKYNIDNPDNFNLILYYFNSNKRYFPSPYLLDGEEVLRAKELFERLDLPVTYRDVEKQFDRLDKDLEGDFDRYLDMLNEIISNRENKENGFQRVRL